MKKIALPFMFLCSVLVPTKRQSALAAPRDTHIATPLQRETPTRSRLSKVLPCRVEPNLNFMRAAPGEFSQEDQLSAAWFARAVQLPDDQRRESWNRLSEKPVRVKDYHAGPFGMHATLLEFESRALLLYRGTQDPFDYLLNATFFTTPGFIHGLPGWVHKGFLINFGLTWRAILPDLKKLGSQGKSLTFAAHSLGGVLSQYAAWRAENAGVSVDRIYAFQSPNPGDTHFKNAFDERFQGRSTNILFGDDLTPHMPPARAAVREFADASLRILSGTLAAIARQANYAPLGERIKLRSTGEVEMVSTEDVGTDEKSYWKSFRVKSGGKGFPQGLGKTSSFIIDHNVETVVCTLARGLSAEPPMAQAERSTISAD